MKLAAYRYRDIVKMTKGTHTHALNKSKLYDSYYTVDKCWLAMHTGIVGFAWLLYPAPLCHRSMVVKNYTPYLMIVTLLYKTVGKVGTHTHALNKGKLYDCYCIVDECWLAMHTSIVGFAWLLYAAPLCHRSMVVKNYTPCLMIVTLLSIRQ